MIAATNVNLEEKVRNGEFREDLFYRLRVVTIYMPPLRDRAEDIMPLVQMLLGKINKELKRNITRLSQDTMNAFAMYDWPGNVRELNNILTKAAALCPGDTITPDLIPEEISMLTQDQLVAPAISQQNEIDDRLLSLEEIEKQHIVHVLRATGGHKGNACAALGISRPRLRRMMQNYAIEE